jgi:DNA modification methylase
VSANSSEFLKRMAAEFRREIIVIYRMDSALVERDIAARRREASLGRRGASMRARIQKELERQGMSEADWCKRELDCDIRTMRRRVQLARGWAQYETARRGAGSNGKYGLVYGLSLISPEPTASATNGHRLSIRSGIDMGSEGLDMSRCQFITGDTLIELRKMRSGSVNAIVCSPPYWPVKRWYGGKGIGFETTLTEYIGKITTIFREAKRVLKDDGVIWIVIGDSYATSGGRWKQDGYKMGRPQKHLMPKGAAYPGADRSPGNLMMIPARLALALQDDGWLLRQEIIWDKGWVRPESAQDRVTRTHDTVYMFAKRKSYFYDQDPIRDQLVSSGGQQRGTMGCDTRRDFRIYNNPLGRNAGSVWRINSGNYGGTHTATFPPELVRRMIASTCGDNSVVLDVFGGAGTTALVALQLGHRAITIDLNPDYTREAMERLAHAPAVFSMENGHEDETGGSTSVTLTTVKITDVSLAAD